MTVTATVDPGGELPADVGVNPIPGGDRPPLSHAPAGAGRRR